ncbi:MAG: DUF434 domain-containing protein [Spirochaetia bacterium]
MSTYYFLNGCKDYQYLINRGYPEKAVRKVVGDRYRLTGDQRNALLRGVFSQEESMERRNKLIPFEQIQQNRIGIDWFNCLITVESYLKGKPVFISTDNLIRDSAANHGSYRKTKITEKALKTFYTAITSLEPIEAVFYIDSPVSFSGKMASDLRTMFRDRPEVSIEVTKSADYPLKRFAGIVCTSDTIIINASTKVFDLAGYIITSLLAKKVSYITDLY